MLGDVFHGEAAYEIVVFSLFVGFDEPIDFGFEVVVAATVLPHVCSASCGVKRDCSIEDATYLLPAFRLQVAAPPASWL